jgi:glycosyltransferase involved in cell wall biosynthesis
VSKEVLIVDDGSTDGTQEFLEELNLDNVVTMYHHGNMGKGSSIRTALRIASGTYIAVQDADREYAPYELMKLISVAQVGNPVVYGSRNLTGGNEISYIRYWLGGLLLTWSANILYGLRLTDLYTGQKLFRRDLLSSLDLGCVGFEFCAEVTARIARKGIPICEVPIAYRPRPFREGKKIRAKDGMIGVWTLIKCRYRG